MINYFNKLENAVNKAKNEKKYGKTAEQFYNMRTTEMEDYLAKRSDVRNVNEAIEEIERLVSKYSDKKSELTEFKNKKFNQPIVKYDSLNGRVIFMSYTEINL